jgi:electron transport complex protein RnfB
VACPVDAIIGAAKWMHTVIAAECTGCELCVAPCPIDCISMIPLENADSAPTNLHAKQRYESREHRKEREAAEKSERLRQQKTRLRSV